MVKLSTMSLTTETKRTARLHRPEVDDLFEGLAWPQAMQASSRFVVSNNCGKLPAVVHGPHAKGVSTTVVDDNIVAFGVE
jgi:hypothetical protein